MKIDIRRYGPLGWTMSIHGRTQIEKIGEASLDVLYRDKAFFTLVCWQNSKMDVGSYKQCASNYAEFCPVYLRLDARYCCATV